MTLMEKEIIDLIYEITELDRNSELNENSSIIDDFYVDSLSLVTLLLRLEDKFDVTIDFDALDFSDIKDVSSLTKFVTKISENE